MLANINLLHGVKFVLMRPQTYHTVNRCHICFYTSPEHGTDLKRGSYIDKTTKHLKNDESLLSSDMFNVSKGPFS